MPKTQEQRERFNAYMRDYKQKNPERAKIWQLNSWIHRLERMGYTVIPPREDPAK